jgi:ketosteroid isomerase-like protein
MPLSCGILHTTGLPRARWLLLPLVAALLAAGSARAQLDPTHMSAPTQSPLTQPTISPLQIELLQQDLAFSKDTEKGGGKAFAKWFTDDAITLNNGKAPTYGKTRIAADANWDSKDYTLSWTPQYAALGPSGDMGYTFGHYEGRSKDAHGNPVSTTGRYITVWKRMPDGKWKVLMDASANEPPGAGDCCALPKP